MSGIAAMLQAKQAKETKKKLDQVALDIDTESLLNKEWQSTRLPTILRKRKGAALYIGSNRQVNIIPKLSTTFRALNSMPSISDCKVVIFGLGRFNMILNLILKWNG